VRLGQGHANVVSFLAGNHDLADQIKAAVLAKVMPAEPQT
jgi:hypothetical protein